VAAQSGRSHSLAAASREQVTVTAPAALTRIWRNIGFLAVALVLIYCVIHAFEPPRLNWGDSGSDYNVMIAGRNFARYGFLNLRLTPNLLDRSVMTNADSGMIYTHYPQLPDLANGVLRKVLGMSDVVQFRLVALLVSFGAFFFVYGLLTTYWSRQAAQVALALWVTNPLWIQHADYLHHGPYGAFFGFGSLYFLARALRGGRARANLVGSGVSLFLAYCSSYDYWIFTPLLLATMTIAHYRRLWYAPVVRTLGLLAAFAIAAMACKLATNIWALGGLGPFIHDLKFQFVERATDNVVHTSFTEGMLPVLYGRTDHFFSLLLFPVTAFWAVFPLIRRRWAAQLSTVDATTVNPLPVLLACLPFLCIFPELWVAQFYPGLMVVPFYAVGTAVLVMLLIESRQPLLRVVGVAVLAAVSVNALYENARFKRAFFDRQAIQTLRHQLDSLAKPGQQVLTNHVFDHAYRYYFDRNVMPMIGHPSSDYRGALQFFSNPALPMYASANGALLVQHKHVTDELFDKGYYYILAPHHLWEAWANPYRYRAFIDSLILERDSALTRESSRLGEKVFESDFYVLWRIPPARTR
jgi:hypothetical protein